MWNIIGLFELVLNENRNKEVCPSVNISDMTKKEFISVCMHIEYMYMYVYYLIHSFFLFILTFVLFMVKEN